MSEQQAVEKNFHAVIRTKAGEIVVMQNLSPKLRGDLDIIFESARRTDLEAWANGYRFGKKQTAQ